MQRELDAGGLEGVVSEFVSEWRRELAERAEGSGGDREGRPALGKRKDNEHDRGHSSPVKTTKSDRGPSPLLVLPAGRGEREGREGKGQNVDLPTSGECTLVDALIKDLDEVNTIPFFDVQLPREMALIIFSYLSVAELCTCARVSHSWRSLAEDNILWCGVCHSLGYETDTDIHSRVDWKTVVKEIILTKKQVERNWKERICGLSDHQPDNVGVLCCVDYCSEQILACYSSGEVWMWDLQDSDGPVRMRQSPSSLAPPPFSCCALTQGWAVVCTPSGNLKMFDTDTCSEVYATSDLGQVNSVAIATEGGVTAVGMASYQSHYPPRSFQETTQSRVMVQVAGSGSGGWERSYLSLPEGEKVTRIALLGHSQGSQWSVLYSTRTTLTLQAPHTPHSRALHLLTSAGARGATCITCFDFTTQTVACGTSAFGYRIQLFDLPSGALRASLGSHGQEVTCVNISSSPPHQLVSGSADKRVRVFDVRCAQQCVMTLTGHGGHVTSVQMDEWKAVSGSMEGTVIVWDQRMGRELWRSHDRHPVALCRFEGSHLVEAHVPINKAPIMDGSNPNICHRRQRGLIRVFDFSVDPLYYSRMLPSICSSAYDEPSASFYNLDLKFPYDAIT